MKFDPQTSHDIWDESDSIDTDTMDQITERYINNEASRVIWKAYYVKSLDTFQRHAAPCHTQYFYLKKVDGQGGEWISRVTS